MGNIKYDDSQINEFIELANDIGIGPAMNELGYPGSWATAQRWYKMRGIDTPNVDMLKSKAAQMHQFYEDKEALLVIQTGLQIAMSTYTSKWESLDPDNQKKMAEAVQKLTNSMRLLQDKANSITESRHKDSLDDELNRMIAELENNNAVVDINESIDNG